MLAPPRRLSHPVNCAIASFVLLLVSAGALAQSVPITTGMPTVQGFDTLASSASSDQLPSGWFLVESGSNANTLYSADNGGVTSGNSYSYGGMAAAERALGGLQSGSLNPTFGARLSNATGAILSSLLVAYTGEQWRLGALARPDRLDFQFSVDATSLTTGTWTNVDALDVLAPVTAGTVGPLNGNSASNRLAISAEISGLNLAANATLWVRWTDLNASGNDDGLAIDDISFGLAGDFPPSVVSSVPSEGETNVPVTAPVLLIFSEPVAMNSSGVALSCNAVAQPLTVTGSGSSRTFTPNAAMPFSASCTLTIAAAAVTDLDANLDPLLNPFTLNFQTGIDNAPTLVSSIPATNTIDFPVNGNLGVTFSEPVNVGPSWFTISCSSSGSRGVAGTLVSGGPIAFTINPNSDFTALESCSLILAAAQILDQDGTPDAFSGPNSVSFSTADPLANPPPVVTSTRPLQGATKFPSAAELRAQFSEPVTLSAGAFTLSCEFGGNIVLTSAASGTEFFIGTSAGLVGSDNCVFRVVASAVSDAGGAHPTADTVIAFSVQHALPSPYYAPVNNSDPQQLRCSLNQVISGHTVYPYTASGRLDTWDVLEMADEDPNNINNILDAYRNESYPKVGGGNNNYNREHTWPNSLGFPDTGLTAYTDTHMLYLTNIGYNSDRDNSRYQNCSGCSERVTVANNGSGGGSGVYPGNSNWFDPDQFEVWSRRKGDMARAVMYMAIRYEGGDSLPNLELTNTPGLITGTPASAPVAYMGLLNTLLAWHQADPPDALELTRNQMVLNFQGNRNPFIDHPEWATLALFQSVNPTTCNLGAPPLIFANGFE